jgi:flagellar biosynthesis anti-sigma factor FlgM
MYRDAPAESRQGMHGTDIRENEGIMRSHGNTACSPGGPSSPQLETIPAEEMKKARARLIHVDQMSFSPHLREIQQAGQMLAHTLEIRETRIAALRKDIESGHYSVKADQVAEKIMKDHLLDLFHC